MNVGECAQASNAAVPFTYRSRGAATDTARPPASKLQGGHVSVIALDADLPNGNHNHNHNHNHSGELHSTATAGPDGHHHGGRTKPGLMPERRLGRGRWMELILRRRSLAGGAPSAVPLPPR